MPLITEADCQNLDRQDPLTKLRTEFSLPDGVVYLDGNSLGALPRAAINRSYQTVVSEWGDSLIASWNTAGWYEMPRRVGNKLAPLIGAGQDEVIVTDSISVNLFKLLAAGLQWQAERDAQRTIIVSERGNFPSDVYIAEGLIAQLGHRHSLRLIDSPDELPAALGADVAIVMLTHVDYRVGCMHNMAAVTRLVKAHGALMLWDLAHSAGAVPVDLVGAGADAAVGCTYKYLNAGPGAPAFLWVPKRHHADFRQPLSGWWGHRSPFQMSPSFEPEIGIGRFLCGTPPIVALSLVDTALDVFGKTDMNALRRKSLALTDLFIALVEQHCPGVGIVTPREHAVRGSQVSLSHPEAFAIVQALIHQGVVGDFREPNILRFGFTPLYTRFIDAWTAAEKLERTLNTHSYDQPRFRSRGAVT